jgi:hypothetical protein
VAPLEQQMVAAAKAALSALRPGVTEGTAPALHAAPAANCGTAVDTAIGALIGTKSAPGRAEAGPKNIRDSQAN